LEYQGYPAARNVWHQVYCRNVLLQIHMSQCNGRGIDRLNTHATAIPRAAIHQGGLHELMGCMNYQGGLHELSRWAA